MSRYAHDPREGHSWDWWKWELLGLLVLALPAAALLLVARALL